MRHLRQTFIVAAILATVWAIGATINKPAPARALHLETATLAGGCFRSLQETLRQIPGVIHTTAGYTGGLTPNPTYEQVAGGKTGHTEAVEVVSDPARLSYAQLLKEFLTARVPARLATRADNPHRPVIFYHDVGQRQTAKRVQDKISQSGKWAAPLIAEINPDTTFYRAEEYHQDYFRKTAAMRTCGLE